MLYTYKYTENHVIESLHQYIEFFFKTMFKEEELTFTDNLIHQDFKCIVDACDKLSALLKDVFEAFKKLDKPSRDYIIEGFKNNNLIEKLCCGDVEPIHYKDIQDPLKTYLEELFTYLYNGVLSTSAYISNHCDMKEHFKASRELNKKYKYCPFCGLYRLNSKYDIKRDDYDHYLPKTKYPFNSVNFRNLVPICGECNTGYKKAKDLLFKDDDKSKRRKAFYPYDNLMDTIIFKLSIVSQGKLPIIDDELKIDITGSLNRNEEIESWNDVFEIKKRYAAEIKDKIQEWLSFFYIHIYKKEKDKPGFDFNVLLYEYLNDLEYSLFTDQNFLRKAAFELLATEYDFEKILNDTTLSA
ncbi:MAG: hypothetical protein ACOYWZ_14840 [Bacillota bacterium]